MTARLGQGRPSETDKDTSKAIACAALQRFAAQGFDATSLREIAREAGVDFAMIAYRFGGKQGLWKAIVTQGGRDLHEALWRASGDFEGSTAQARLGHSARAFLAYMLDRPEVPRLLFRDINVDSDRSQRLLETLSLPLHRHFIQLAETRPPSVQGR